MAKRSSKNLEIRGIEIIPGIGVIRVRCLRKAGYESIESLKDVTHDEIASIPGIGDAKARQIKEFVEQLTSTVDRPLAATPSNGADSAKKIDSANRSPNPGTKTSKQIEAAKHTPDSGTDFPLPLTDAIKQVTQTASELLRAPISQQFQPELARQIGRIAAIAIERETKRKQTERALSQTAKLTALLATISEADDLPKKRQERLSEELRDRRRKLNQALS